MATATRDITFSKSAYVKESSPSKTFPTDASTAYVLGEDTSNYKENLLYFGGANSWPSSLKRNKIIQAKIHVYLKFESLTCDLICCKDFDASKITYNNAPDYTSYQGWTSAAHADVSTGAWHNVWVTLEDPTKPTAAIYLLKNGAFYIDAPSYSPYIDSPWYGKTRLSDGTKPVVRIYYDDAVKVKSKVVIGTKLSGTVNPEVSHKITWNLQKDGSDRCYDEVWTQTSAKVYWKASDASSWNGISISGTTNNYTFPAFTFPTGKTIQYYVQATDNDGTTTTTATYTFTTPASQITPQNSPTSGYRNPRQDISFSWYFKHTNGNYPQQSASLFWKTSTDANWTEVPASGATQSLTIPGTAENPAFPIASTIQWYLYGTDSSGSASRSPTSGYYSFTTAAATTYAVATSPKNSVEDGSAPIRFEWTITSSDGYAASRVEVWWKTPEEDNNSWHVLADVSSPITSCIAAAGTFPAGEIQWKVRAYNIDGTAGPFDANLPNPNTFICVSAPDPVEGLVATPVPLTTISWQSEEQQAYRIQIDGVTVQQAFGVDIYSWQVREPLPDGVHVITVEVQGVYGLWSQPSETSIFIDNTPEALLGISGKFGVDAVLTAEYSELDSETVLHWYRDGKYIAKTTGTLVFTDRLSLGEHSYRVELWHASGNYTRSDTITGATSTRNTLIAPFEGGLWLSLKLSENSNSEQTFTWSRDTSIMHVTGAKFPVIEISTFENLAGSYNCAFTNQLEKMRFEALRGRIVILKSRRGNIVIGALVQLQKREKTFYTAYTFTVQEIDWEDFIDDQGS